MLCQICEKKEAVHVCPNCGARVCEDHFNKNMNLCSKCSLGKQI